MKEQSQWGSFLLEQAKRHPSMEPQDVYKLMYQAAFGAEHLLADKEAAYRYLQTEFEELPANGISEAPLYEPIGDGICRVNLQAWKRKALPVSWLFRMFEHSVMAASDTGAEDFFLYRRIAREKVEEGIFGFSLQEFDVFGEEYEKQGLHPVHHSETYRKAEYPAYRLICSRQIRLLPILEKIGELLDSAPAIPATITVTIDGRCASGKTTMATMLSYITGAGVVHMDDFFLPMELRTTERLAEPGGNVHYERFAEEVLPFLRGKDDFYYRRFQCSTMTLGDAVPVQYHGQESVPVIRIVEGAYSMHPYFGDYGDIKVFSDVSQEEQLRRIANREGREAVEVFRNQWIPLEEKYLEQYQIAGQADICL